MGNLAVSLLCVASLIAVSCFLSATSNQVILQIIKRTIHLKQQKVLFIETEESALNTSKYVEPFKLYFRNRLQNHIAKIKPVEKTTTTTTCEENWSQKRS